MIIHSHLYTLIDKKTISLYLLYRGYFKEEFIMENKIIINEKIAEVFLEILAQDSIKHILNPEFIINKNFNE